MLPPSEQVPGEVYEHGQRIKCVVVHVSKGFRGPQITLSRSHPSLVKKLFALEVPEIADGTVEIAAIAREAGHRTKIAVRSTVPGVNAKGACIGPMGQRVRAVMSELNGEKIDIIDWSEDPAEFVGNALSPAKALRVEVVDLANRTARVTVPDYQLSLAIGREGQNARLAARLTGWRIDIRSDAEPSRRPAARRRRLAGYRPESASDRVARLAASAALDLPVTQRASSSCARAPGAYLRGLPAAGTSVRATAGGRGRGRAERAGDGRSGSCPIRPAGGRVGGRMCIPIRLVWRWRCGVRPSGGRCVSPASRTPERWSSSSTARERRGGGFDTD